MAAGAVPSARDPQRDLRWKWSLLGLCALGGVLVFSLVADYVGLRGPPWGSFWGSSTILTDRAYIGAIVQTVPREAAAKAGLRDGDNVDLREQDLEARERFLFSPVATQPVSLLVHRGARVLTVTVLGTTLWEAPALDWLAILLEALSAAWFLVCAILIASRRWWLFEARVLALVMLCQIGALLGFLVLPSAKLELASFVAAYALGFAEAVLLVAFSSRFGDRVWWRQILESCAYILNAIPFLASVVATIGIATLRIDPLRYLSALGYIVGGNATFWTLFSDFAALTVALCAIAAVTNTSPAQRSRTAWLLLPLALTLAGFVIVGSLEGLAPSIFWYTLLQALAMLCWLFGGLCVTYALLKRRVLDFGFVLNRAVVVSIVGLIVVIAFVLLEWILGSVLTGVSHATGLIANAALALVIGVSLNYVHKRVDQSVDLVLFRKRHQDEQSLLAFSKEAAYITEWDALLDATLEKVRRHTDARSAAVLIGVDGFYTTIRSFCDNAVVSVNENDEAILALKVWHKPIDPHHYDTSLHAALALPMLSRGKLYGVLILAERSGGEAYAPDEVEALSQLANGVGSALEALSLMTDGSATALASYVAGLHHAIASVGETLAEMRSEIRAHGTSSPT